MIDIFEKGGEKMDMAINLVSTQPEANNVVAQTSTSSSSKVPTKNSNNTSDKKSGKDFNDILADANAKTQSSVENISDTSSGNLMNNMAGLTNIAVLVAINSLPITQAVEEPVTNVENMATAITAQGEENKFSGIMQNELKGNQVLNQFVQTADLELTTEVKQDHNASSLVNANTVLGAEKIDLTSDITKTEDMLQKNSSDLEQMDALKTLVNKDTTDGKVVVETTIEAPVLQELQVANNVLEKPLAKATVADKNTGVLKDNSAHVKLSSVDVTENADVLLTNVNAAQNLSAKVDSRANADSTLTNNTLSVAEKPAKSQMPEIEGASNHTEQPNTNQFGQFVTLATNQLDKNMSAEATTAITTPQALAEYDIPGQIVEQAHLIKGTEDTQMVIKLKPEHLGELTLKVTVENGTVSASFHSDNSQVRGLLETTMAQLKQDLTSQGIKVDTVGVYGGLGKFLSDGQSQPGQQGQNSRFKNRKINVDDFEDEVDKVGRLMSISGVTDDGVDYRV
ncbi:MAG: Flagellar hook-length control protein-like protein [Firmicutes bacterium]|nr:Flagellar hook-length control protein-like protein [Bacillota bacterium]